MAAASSRPQYNPYLIVAVVTLGNFIGPLYSSVANVLVPQLIASFKVGVETMEWTVTGYMLGYSVVTPVSGWLSDTFGRKRVFLLGLAIFLIGSVCASLAWSAGALIAFRMLQALGGGLISPTGLAIVNDVIPAAQRGRALGLWAMGVMLAPAIGPWVSGTILDKFFDWRPVFLLGVPFGLAALIIGAVVLPAGRANEKRSSFDTLGCALLTVAIVCFLVPVTQASRIGWGNDLVWIGLAISAASFTAFAVHELRSPAPMIDLRLFKDQTFSVAIALRGVVAGGYYVPVFLLPLFVEDLLGWTAAQSGAMLLPAGVALALIMPLSGFLSDRIGPRPIVIVGAALAAIGTFLFTSLDGTWDHSQFIWYNVIRNGALGLLFTPLTAAALASIPRNRAGQASAIINTVWQLGGSVAIAVGEAYLQIRTAASTPVYAYRAAFMAGAILMAACVPVAFMLGKRQQREA
ncbi:MAG TPA: DHA2 family efflux MFS transporter permease subunit [Candidatus Binatia bacterium]|nr:DHA2 family efflux MFS transporter permease subunit [Candidatus Binatia bacterium]